MFEVHVEEEGGEALVEVEGVRADEGWVEDEGGGGEGLEEVGGVGVGVQEVGEDEQEEGEQEVEEG